MSGGLAPKRPVSELYWTSQLLGALQSTRAHADAIAKRPDAPKSTAFGLLGHKHLLLQTTLSFSHSSRAGTGAA